MPSVLDLPVSSQSPVELARLEGLFLLFVDLGHGGRGFAGERLILVGFVVWGDRRLPYSLGMCRALVVCGRSWMWSGGAVFRVAFYLASPFLLFLFFSIEFFF